MNTKFETKMSWHKTLRVVLIPWQFVSSSDLNWIMQKASVQVHSLSTRKIFMLMGNDDLDMLIVVSNERDTRQL